MNIKKILTAAAAVAVLSVGGVTAASAGHVNDRGRYGTYDNGDINRDGVDNRYGARYGDSDWNRDNVSYGNSGWYGNGDGRGYHRPFANRHMILAALRMHHMRAIGQPFFIRGHFVVRTFNRFGRIALVEINPYTGRLVGYVRL